MTSVTKIALPELRWLTIVALLVLPLVSGSGHADSFVWKVNKGERELFLGGTIHALAAGDYPLPNEFDEAYLQADTVVFETDIGVMDSPEFHQVVLAKLMYTDGTTLESQLAPATWQKLASYFTERHMPAETATTMKPGMIYSMLAVLEMQRLGIDQAGVDEHYYEKAVADDKSLIALETPSEQLDFIAALGAGNADALILNSLDDIARMPELMELMVNAWKQGDVQTMNEIMIAELETRYPSVYESLLVTRNRQWLPRIVSMLDTEEVEIVLVGAAHLAGKDGLLAMLQDQGFVVEQL